MGRKWNRVDRRGVGGRGSLLPVLVLMLAQAACSSDPTVPETEALPRALFGSWAWVRATGGIAGVTQTPETEGYSRTITFTAPGQVVLFWDGQPEVTTTFEFVPKLDNGSVVRSAQLVYAAPLTGWDEQWVEITGAGELVLSDPCCDGFTYEWRRE